MVQILERPELRHEGDSDTLVREPQEVAPPRTPVIEHPEIDHAGRRRPVRWMGWLQLIGLLAISAVVVVLASDRAGEPASQPAGQFHTADWWERQLTPAVVPEPAVEFHTADWWERQLTPIVAMPTAMPTVATFHTVDWWEHVLAVGPLAGPVFHTADWWEHMVTPQVAIAPVATFHTADWWEHMVTPQVAIAPVATFHTADWWEHVLAVEPLAGPVFHSADWWEHMVA
jgi:hypothetical protein